MSQPTRTNQTNRRREREEVIVNLDPVAISDDNPTDPMIIAKESGAVNGISAAVSFLFSGHIDNAAIIVLDRRLRNGDLSAINSLPQPEDGVRPYPPNAIAIRAMLIGDSSVDSPYSWYLELCEAYDTAFTAAVCEHIRTIARTVRP